MDTKNFGFLKLFREMKGLRQGQLSAATKIPIWNLTMVENGRRNLPDRELVKICEALNVSPQEYRLLEVQFDGIVKTMRGSDRP